MHKYSDIFTIFASLGSSPMSKPQDLLHEKHCMQDVAKCRQPPVPEFMNKVA